MNRKGFRKFAFGVVFSMVVSLFASSSAAFAQDPFIEPSLIRDGTSNTILFGDGSVRFISECESWRDQSGWSTERINTCLTHARDLKNKFNSFRQGYQSIGDKIRGANKWNNQLDQEFERNFQRNNGNAALLDLLRRHNGFRSLYQKSNGQLNQLANALDKEIRDLTDRANGGNSNGNRNRSLDRYKGIIYFASNFGCGLINTNCFRPSSGFEQISID